MSGYDVVGDVHGEHEKLVGLLDRMGYGRSGATWSQPHGRQLVFVGDVIDRGLPQRDTVDLVRRLIDDGVALITMGNHEWNAISYATLHPTEPGRYLRSRDGHHVAQHEQFLTDYPLDSPEHEAVIEWFRTIPLWLELDGLRIVHACWSEEHIAHLRTLVGPKATVTESLLERGNHKPRTPGETNPTYDAIETVLKGPEVLLPSHLWYQDKERVVRKRARLRWWGDGPTTLRNLAQSLPDMKNAAGEHHPGFDDTPITEAVPAAVVDGDPVIVGHYWFSGAHRVLSDKVACVDYSAAKGGPLVAYRWSGETALIDAHFASYP